MTSENKPLKLRYVCSYGCEGKCPFCHHEGLGDEEEFDLDRIERLIKSFRRRGLREATVTGGEPFPLHTVLPVIDILDKNGFNLTLTMSGVGLTDHDLQRLVKNISNFHLSVPSFDQGRYHTYTGSDFARFELLLDRLLESDMNVRLNYTITRDEASNWQCALQYAIRKQVNLCLQDIVWCSLYKKDTYQRLFTDVLELVGKPQGFSWRISSGYAPRLVYQIQGITVEVKASQLSRLQRYDVCNRCRFDTRCTERICAVRMYPSGRLGLCLEGPRKVCWAGNSEEPESAVDRLLSVAGS